MIGVTNKRLHEPMLRLCGIQLPTNWGHITTTACTNQEKGRIFIVQKSVIWLFLSFLTIVFVKRTLVLLIVKLDNLAGVLHWCNGENVMAKQWYLYYTLTLICIVLFFSVITAQITITTRATLYGGVHGQEFKAHFLLLSLLTAGSGISNQKIFACRIRNPGLWNPETH